MTTIFFSCLYWPRVVDAVGTWEPHLLWIVEQRLGACRPVLWGRWGWQSRSKRLGVFMICDCFLFSAAGTEMFHLKTLKSLCSFYSTFCPCRATATQYFQAPKRALKMLRVDAFGQFIQFIHSCKTEQWSMIVIKVISKGDQRFKIVLIIPSRDGLIIMFSHLWRENTRLAYKSCKCIIVLDKIHYCKSLLGKIMVERNGKQGKPKCLSQSWRWQVTAGPRDLTCWWSSEICTRSWHQHNPITTWWSLLRIFN